MQPGMEVQQRGTSSEAAAAEAEAEAAEQQRKQKQQRCSRSSSSHSAAAAAATACLDADLAGADHAVRLAAHLEANQACRCKPGETSLDVP